MPKIYSMHEKGCEFAGKFAYTGRTVRSLEERLRDHKRDANSGDPRKVYQHMRKRNPENFVMTLLQEVEETIKGEGAMSMWLGTELNTNTPGLKTLLGQKEYSRIYCAINRGVLNARSREYAAVNREAERKRNREYHTNNKEVTRERKRKYRAENRGTMRVRGRKYYATNREVINTRRREKVTCSCGKIISRGSMSNHLKTKDHIKVAKNG